MLALSFGREGGEADMYKRDVVKAVTRKVRLPEEDVADVINATLDVIQEELQAGESVTFPGFGKFYTSKRQGGTVQHAKSHEVIEYAARRVALFHTGDILKRAVRVERKRK